MARHPVFGILCAGLLALALSGCAAQRAYREGNSLVAQDKVAAGLLKYQEAVAADPSNPLYRSAFLRARDAEVIRLVEQADRERAAGKQALALQDYQRVFAIDPDNDRAREGLRGLEADQRVAKLLDEARAAEEAKNPELARQKLGAILTEQPGNVEARKQLAQLDAKNPPVARVLDEAFRKPISLEFRDAPLKQIFEVIGRHAGLNFLFDKDVKIDQRTSIFLKNSTVDAAMYYLLMTNQLQRQVMDGNTVLIYPNIPAKLKDYQEMMVKTFFLSNAEAKNIANTLKTILKSRDVVVDEKLNLVILRDSPEAIKLASRLVALQDVPEPEVMLDVEVLEIQRSRALDLGIAWPTSLSFAPLQTASGGPLTIDQLRGLNGSSIGVSGVSATINANKTDGDSNTLAHPRIRVRNKEKAKVVIGDKVPVITTTISPGVGGFASESVNYVDVGLTLNVEPTIYLDNEVGIRISLEVSNLIDTVQTKSGSTVYRIGTRSATTMLQLKDGENQVLAGLIKSEDRSSGSKVPGLGSLPVLGRLFGSTSDSNGKTEVVLSITPHLVRNIQRPTALMSEFSAGTEASFMGRPDSFPRAPVQLPLGRPMPQSVPAAQPTQPPGAAPVGQPVVLPPNVPAVLPSTLPATPQTQLQVNPIPSAPPAPGQHQ
jgi:general secretion pathway protein D